MSDPLEDLIAVLAHLPGLGRRSAQRIALHLLARRERVMVPLAKALENAGGYRGLYHVVGGVLSALDGVGPKDLHLEALPERAQGMAEVILALSATVDGYTTAHYITDLLQGTPAKITRLAQGLPVGGQLDHMDAGTIAAALRARREEG